MVTTKIKKSKQVHMAQAGNNNLQQPKKVNFPMELKVIPTHGTPKGSNPIMVGEKARIPAFNSKLKECLTSLLNLNKATTQLQTAEDFYLERYKMLGQKITEAKIVYFNEFGKKLSDQAFADTFNKLYDQKVSRAIVMRARRLAEQWHTLDRTRRLCLIRGEDWKNAMKYDRETIKEEKAKRNSDTEQKPTIKHNEDGEQVIAGMDTFDIFSKALDKLQAEGEPLNDILDVFLSSLTSTDGKFSYKQVENTFKKVFHQMTA